MPPQPSPHGTGNRWRTGCRCPQCRSAHVTDIREDRRADADESFPPPLRRKVLKQIGAGGSPVEVAKRHGLQVQQLYARGRRDEKWAEQLDAALMEGRNPDIAHGTEQGYRHGKCRCPECRAAHRR